MFVLKNIETNKVIGIFKDVNTAKMMAGLSSDYCKIEKLN